MAFLFALSLCITHQFWTASADQPPNYCAVGQAQTFGFVLGYNLFQVVVVVQVYGERLQIDRKVTRGAPQIISTSDQLTMAVIKYQVSSRLDYRTIINCQ